MHIALEKALQHLPTGYAIVPTEPTPEMVKAGNNVYDNARNWTEADTAAHQMFRAMVAATPIKE